MWIRIKNFLRENDCFAVSFSFRYKREDKFSTWQGGIITFIIVLLYIFFGVFYLVPFIRKENYTLFYNTINLQNADSIMLNIGRSKLAVRLECGNDEQEKELYKYLFFNVTYYSKNSNKSKTSPTGIEEFGLFNQSNNTKFKNIRRLNKASKSYNISGKFGDPIFQYIQISLISKKNTSDYISKIDEILFKNDCKLEFHYPDYTIHYDKFEEPFEEFSNEFFLQLNPYFCVKMNVFFMKQTLTNDNDLLFEYKDEEINKTLFSRSEQYFLYKGHNNTKVENRPKDYESYAKIYLRADSKRVEIKRKYQTFFEFWADTFSFWNALTGIIAFILSSFYKFYAFHFIGNELFIFKENGNNNIDFSEKNKEIKRLMDITTIISKETERSSKKNLKNNEKNNENNNQTLFNLREEDKIKKNNIQKTSKYSFYFYEIPLFIKYLKIFSFIQICKCKKLISKLNLYSKAKNIIKEKLNIVLYIKNMLYLDTFKKKISYEDKEYILKFLDMPLISSVQSEIGKYNTNNNIYFKSSIYGKSETDILKLTK